MSVVNAGEEFGKNRAAAIGLSFLLAGAILAFDVSLPLGVAAGVPYVALVLLGFGWRSDWAPIVLAIVATGLTIAGYFASSPGGMVWMALINRALAIFAIWVTALMVFGRKRDLEALCEARDTLDKQVGYRTAELLRANENLKTEIFERKIVDDKLRDSERFLRGIMNIGADAIISVDDAQKITLFNESAERIFGYDADEVIGRDLEILVPSAARMKHSRQIEAFAESGRKARTMAERAPIAGLRKDGTEFPAEAAISHFRNSGKSVFTVALRDISERKRAEEALRESENNFANLAANVPGVVYQRVLHDDGTTTYPYVSSGVREIYGYEPEDITADPSIWRGSILPEDMESYRTTLAASIEGMSQWLWEGRITTKAGTVKWIQWSARPRRSPSGGIAWDGLILDISKRKQTENELLIHRNYLEDLVMARTAELEQRSDQLEQALSKERALNELQQQFVSMVSHEFRTPLTIIEGSAQRMMRRADRLTPEDVQQRTGRIRSAVKRMTGLIESTLCVSRLDAGKFEMNPTYIDAAELVAENCLLQQEISASHDISVDVAAISRPIYADSDLLNQIFANLLSNATKYSPTSCRVEVKGIVEDEHVLVSIRDYGLGISANDVPRLFERFFRAGTSTGIAGTGIGLHLVKQLVELHGGSIAVESVEGKGSTFTVRLPIEPAKDVIAHGPVGTASPAHITAAAEPGGRRQRWP